MSVYRRALVYFTPFAGRTAAGVALSLVGVGLNLLKPWPFKFIIDDVLAPAGKRGSAPAWLAQAIPMDSPVAALGVLCLAVVAIHLLAGLFSLFANLLFVRVGLQALLQLRTDLYAYLQSLPLKFHDARRSSDSTFRVAYDSQSIQTLYNRGFTNILGAVITVIGAFAVLFNMDWRLTLVSMAVLPLNVFAVHYFADRVRRQSTTIQERESAVYAVAQEGLSAVRMVHAFGREDFEVAQFRQEAHESLRANLALTFTSLNSALIIGALMAAGTAALYYVGSLHVLSGELALGELIVFASYLAMLYQPLEQLTYTAWTMEGAAAAAQRCFEVLDRPDEVSDRPHAVELKETRGRVRFDHVSFSYSGERTILHDIDVEVEPGQAVAFVGGTGAGKSTLLSLVPRFYDPSAGRVLLDGRDVRDITKKSLRRHVSVVLQDTVLFSTTVRENIAYGRPDATDTQIVEAAKRAQAHDFITEMEAGYRSQVGERGSHLSVGQRQRIGIARAFLKNAPILLLDEPTSALDPSTEQAIMAVIEDLMRGRTTLIITHRIATIHKLSKIVVLDHGRVVEIGGGAELVARGGTYAKLHQAAMGQADGHYPVGLDA
ncbi:MAG: ABC transporter ATP-binding protein [Caulobacteraceae bacterium]